MDLDTLSGEIGKGLQWLRKSLLLTQYQLASLTELDYRHYQNIETGRVEVKVETLKRICSTFGVSLSTFFALLDRQPWMTETPTRGKGATGSELYLYRLILEQACFRVLPPIRDVLSKSGRDLAEGSRENLTTAPFPCLEIDSHVKVLWKNAAAVALWSAVDRDISGIPPWLDSAALDEDISKFFDHKSNSFYLEYPVAESAHKEAKGYAIVGLKPMTIKPDQTLFLAFVELEEKELSTGVFMNMQNMTRKFLS